MSSMDPGPRLPTTSAERRILAIVGIVLLGLLAAEFARDFTVVKLGALWMAFFLAPLVVLHELGHAVVALLVGWRVDEIVIGFGRELARFRIGSCLVRLRMAPLEGYVVPSPSELRHARVKSALIYAAGPGAELALVGLLWLLVGDELTRASHELGMLALQGLSVAALMDAFFNLVPFPSAVGVRDGLGILVSLAMPEAAFRRHLLQPFLREARRALYAECPERGLQRVEEGLVAYPDDPELAGLRAVCEAGLGRREEAFQGLERLGHPDDHAPPVRAELLLDAAAVVLLTGDRALLPDAQRACQRTGQLSLQGAWAHLIVGRVLFERGDYESAHQTLMRGYERSRDPDEEGQFIAYLALVAKKLDHGDHAARFFAATQGAVLGRGLRRRVDEAFAASAE